MATMFNLLKTTSSLFPAQREHSNPEPSSLHTSLVQLDLLGSFRFLKSHSTVSAALPDDGVF